MGQARQDIFVVTSNESYDCTNVRLFLVTAYDLDNASEKLEVQSHAYLAEIDVKHCTITPQLFVPLKFWCELNIIFGTIVEVPMSACLFQNNSLFNDKIHSQFTLEYVFLGPIVSDASNWTSCSMIYDDVSKRIDADEKFFIWIPEPFHAYGAKILDLFLKILEKQT